MDVSVRDLKARLSEYLRRVQKGEVVVVTSRGKPVARIVGPGEVPATPEAGVAERLRKLPWIRPGAAGRTPLGAREALAHRAGRKTLAEIVSEDRG